ncbi:MAG: hypothetical protein M0R02_06660 [Bacteroidales bacterium]|nr:hypothetical protein [Bacteroidales bacterium]NLK81218.1 hypothetical protein [Bacteroidales bacterium]
MMQEQEEIFEHIQKLFDTNPESFNIIEEEIDIGLQMNYLKRSKKLQKHTLKLEEVLAKVPLLQDTSVRFEEKRDLLIHLANFDEVEAFRAIESFWETAEEEIKPWASMAYRESKMLLESSLLNEKQILISTGLGGKGYKLRFFIALVHAEKENFNDTQKKLITNEVEYAVQSSQGEMESVDFENDLAKITALIPINASVKKTIKNAITECNQYGNFLSEHFLITNIKKLESFEIYTIINQRTINQYSEEFDEFDEEDDE